MKFRYNKNLPIDYNVYDYIENFFLNSGKTEFPTLRQVAKRFKITQKKLLELVEYNDLFIVDTAIGISGFGYSNFERIGDYIIETDDEAFSDLLGRFYYLGKENIKAT